MNTHLLKSTMKGKSPLAFFLLAMAIYIPFVFNANVNTFVIGAFIPVTAALILVYWENGTEGVVELLQRSFDYKRIKSGVWYLPVLLLYPSIVLMLYGLAILSGAPVPLPQFSFWTPIGFVIIFVAALGEELGWMGYAYEPMQERLGALKASLALGVIWVSVHIPLYVMSGASHTWIVWDCIFVVMTRVLFVWIYNNTGKSIFAVALLHTMFNFVWQVIPPGNMVLIPLYNPGSLAVITSVLAAVVTFLWGSKTLAEYRFAPSGQLSAKK